jgi:hypothetical protein
MHVSYSDDGLRWLINDDDDYIMMYLPLVMLVILNVVASGCTFIHV